MEKEGPFHQEILPVQQPRTHCWETKQHFLRKKRHNETFLARVFLVFFFKKKRVHRPNPLSPAGNCSLQSRHKTRFTSGPFRDAAKYDVSSKGEDIAVKGVFEGGVVVAFWFSSMPWKALAS